MSPERLATLAAMRCLRLGLVGVVLLLSGGVQLVPATAQTADKQINTVGPPYAFSPAGGQIESGKSLLWENHSDTNHNVSSSEFTRPVPAGEGARSQPVTISGSPRTIEYECTIHPEMKGTLQVVAATSSATGAPATTAATSASTTRTTARSTTSTARRSTSSTSSVDDSTTSSTFLDTTTSEETTSTTSAPLAIKENNGGGGTSGVLIGAVVFGILAVVGGGGYALYRLRSGAA
jgi:plastocyanin